MKGNGNVETEMETDLNKKRDDIKPRCPGKNARGTHTHTRITALTHTVRDAADQP